MARAAGVLLALAFMASAAGWTAASTGRRALALRFTDRVARTSCPANAPAGAECFLLRSTTHARGWGTVRTGPTLDVEAPQGSRACGKSVSFRQRLRFPAGTLTAEVTGPRFCLGRVGIVQRRFRVVGGTGAFAAAMGSGKVTVHIESTGALEVWRGTLSGLHHG